MTDASNSNSWGETVDMTPSVELELTHAHLDKDGTRLPIDTS